MSDSEESEFSEPPSDSGSDFSEEEEEVARPVAKKAAKQGGRKAKKPSDSDDDDDAFDFVASDDDEESDAAAGKKKPQQPKKPRKKAAEAAVATKPKKPHAPAKKKKAREDDASDSDAAPRKAPKAADGSKARKPHKKKTDSEPEAAAEPAPAAPAAAAAAAAAAPGSPGKPRSPKKGRTVEELYQKLTQVEHCLKRPDTYIGSVEHQDMQMWVLDGGSFVQRSVSFVPGLYKIFDEILVNAADNKQRDAHMDTLRVTIDVEKGEIEVWNNGAGIPVEMHKKEGVYVPELIFGHLLTGSNYSDDVKKVTGGRNGYGAKLANIFSLEFTIETADGKHSYRQTWHDNMGRMDSPTIRDSDKEFTRVRFRPDFGRFGMTGLEPDTVALMRKRVHDVAGCLKNVRVYLDGKRIGIKSFKDYVQLYLQPPSAPTPAAFPDTDTTSSSSAAASAAAPSNPLTNGQFVFETLNERWEVAVALSDGQFQQVSFVNSICTLRGGTHVNLVADMLAKFIGEKLTKKSKKAATQIKPFTIKSHLWVFVNCLIENPAFDSQTKETLTTKTSAFGSKPEMPDTFQKKVLKLGVVQAIQNWQALKDEALLRKKGGAGGRRGRLAGLTKLSDANNAGTRRSGGCTLILTEGDSAASLALSGLSVVGRDNFGVFPLRGKVLNVRDAAAKQVMSNEELKHICQAMGLQYGQSYTDASSLRYGHLMVMADQDFDGSHIKGLIINFIAKFWPGLLRCPGFLTEFVTPIIKATKGKQEISFFTVPQYEEWKRTTPQAGWRIKYYKGLGTSTSAEGKAYFTAIDKHRIDFAYTGAEDDAAIDLAFNKKKADERKAWMAAVEPGTYLDHDVDEIPYHDFVNRELVLFSLADCERSIPSMMDGFKPGQRKILYVCFRKNMKREIKVCEMSGIVSSLSAYHHGEVSLHETIVGMAQNYVGSNNVNVLYPSGQFGSRRQGGKDHASARYIHTRLSDITRKIFHQDDDAVLDHLDEDGKTIEPRWYVPLIPMALVNGSEGIGTGWSTSIPCFNPRDLIANVRRLLHGEPQQPLVPWFRGWKGRLVLDEKTKNYRSHGIWRRLSPLQIEITELPLRSWTQPYKDFLEELTTANEKHEALVKDFKEYHGEETVHFVIDLLKEIPDDDVLIKTFRLSGPLNVSNMVAFDETGRITQFKTPEELVERFFRIRMEFYQKRKDHLLSVLSDQQHILEMKWRFIKAVLDKKLKLRNRKRAEILADLQRLGIEPAPKNKAADKSKPEAGADADGEDEDAAGDDTDGEKAAKSDYDYLLNMPLWSITAERAAKLMRELEEKRRSIEELKATTLVQLYERDLDELAVSLDEWERIEEEQLRVGEKDKKTQVVSRRGGKGKGKGKGKKPSRESDDDDDDFDARPSRSRKKKEETKPKTVVAAPAPAPAPAAKPKVQTQLPLVPIPAVKPSAPAAAAAAAASTSATATKPLAAPAESKKKKAPAKKRRKEEDSDEESDDEDEEDLASRLKKRSPESRQSLSAMEESPAPRPRRTAATRARVVVDDDDDDDFEDDEPAPASKKKEAPKPPAVAPTAKPPPAPATQVVDLDSPSEEESAPKKRKPAPTATAAATRKPKKRAALVEDSDDEEEADETFDFASSSDEEDKKKKKKKQTKAKPAAAEAASTTTDGESPQRRSGRSRTRVNYAEAAGDDDSDE